jgi:hypothetical protein
MAVHSSTLGRILRAANPPIRCHSHCHSHCRSHCRSCAPLTPASGAFHRRLLMLLPLRFWFFLLCFVGCLVAAHRAEPCRHLAVPDPLLPLPTTAQSEKGNFLGNHHSLLTRLHTAHCILHTTQDCSHCNHRTNACSAIKLPSQPTA